MQSSFLVTQWADMAHSSFFKHGSHVLTHRTAKCVCPADFPKKLLPS